MMIISQNHAQNTPNYSKLNPAAPEYFPNFTHHPTKTYPNHSPPLRSQFFYPPQPTVVNIIYHRNITPPPTKSIFYNSDKDQLAILPPTESDLFTTTPPTSPTKPTVLPAPTRLSEPRSKVVRKARNKPKKMGRVLRPGSGSGTWFWAKKEAINDPVAVASSYPFADSTSLMIRNIPVRYSRSELMELLDQHCSRENEKKSTNEPASEFDFLYLPVDFKRKGNLGYAFVNFTTWQGALRLFNSWNSSNWENCPYKTKKICQINRAKYQGKQELRRHFERSVFRCEKDEYLPVVMSPPRNGANAELTKVTAIGTRVW